MKRIAKTIRYAVCQTKSDLHHLGTAQHLRAACRHVTDHRAEVLGLQIEVNNGMSQGLRIAFFGSSLASASSNRAATYYRAIIRALYERGHRITVYEPEAFGQQTHRDIDDPEWARVIVYPAHDQDSVCRALDQARGSDLVIKASGIGVFDDLLEREIANMKRPDTLVAFWDADTHATLNRVEQNPGDPFASLIPRYDMILTYGGGDPVVSTYTALGACHCVPVYNALNPTTHYTVPPDTRFAADLSFLGNRLPDREARVEEFFLGSATALPQARFLLAGNGWDQKGTPPNVRYVGYVDARDHNAFNCTPLAVLNITRESMVRCGYSPTTRIFEAAGAGACLISDEWVGLDLFLEPGKEVLVARDGREVAEQLRRLTPDRARTIGHSALKRVLAEHTYAHRAAQLEDLFANGTIPMGVAV